MTTASHAPPTGDRRSYLRVPARGVVSYLETAEASLPVLAVENVSLGGLFVRSAALLLALGTELHVLLVRKATGEAIGLAGRVVSVISPAEAQARGISAGMGIRIDAVDAGAADGLRALVANLAITERAGAEPTTTIAQLAAEDDDDDDETLVWDMNAGAGVAQDRLIRSLQEEVSALRRELLRRGRTITDMANHIRAIELAQPAAAPISPRTPAVGRRASRAA